jgi:lysophospholipase L1-like esterase
MSGSGTRRLRDALAVAAASLALAAALEVGARWLGLGAPDAVPVRAPAPGVFRILALGGSTVQGVPDGAQGFVAQLERGLRRVAPGRPLEVVNLARAGANSTVVRATLEAALAERADLAIVLMGHNEFLAPPPGPLQRVRDASHLARAVAGVFAGDPPPEEPFPDALVPVDRNGRAYRRSVGGFLANLDAVVAAAARAGVPLYLCTAPANLADWPPADRRLAEPHVRPDPDRDALRLYREGRTLAAGGQAEAARERFARARDLDPIPRRAFGSFNDAVRAHAGSAGVRVIDVAARFEEIAEHGLVGFDLVCDNCHPTPKGNAVIAREIASAMAEDGLFLARATPVAPLATWLGWNEAALGDAAQRRDRKLRWLLSNAIYAMKTPFFHYEVSRRYLREAEAIAPDDWRVHANLATLDLLEGNHASGRLALARAQAARGAPLDPEDRSATPYLKEALAALEAAGAPDPSLTAPGPPEAQAPSAGGS